MTTSPWKKLISSLLILVIGGGVGYGVGQRTKGSANIIATTTPSPTSKTTNENLDFSPLNQAWGKIKNNFYFKDRIDNQDGIYGATEGLINSLGDPYTVFFSPDASADFNDSLHGTLEGIGAELGVFEGNLTVTSIIKDSPAFHAGIKAKDIIYKIEDEIAGNLTLGQAVEKIRGPRGTKVTLTIIHEGDKNSTKVEVTRDVINIKEIEYEMLENDIAIISIHQFTDDTHINLWEIGRELVEKNPKGIILDLRWDPGGYLEAAVDVTSFFLKEGAAVKKVLRTDSDTMNVTGKAVFPDLPLIVMINGGSASASEIVAGALRDNNRATLLGEKSFGKGTIQELHPLPNGASIKITIGKWFPPSGEDIDHKGITPDIVVPLDDEAMAKGKDNQKDRAIEEIQKLIAKKK